jgi:PDDEXK-like domain of unknown function (DUF3799)
MSQPTTGIFHDMPSNDYHGMKNSYSSTQLKDALEDPEYFYRKHVVKEIAREESPAFDVGSYFHCAVLEPEKLGDETAVFEGIRRGEKWEKFKEDNKGKAIITKGEFEQAKGLVEAVKSSPVAMGRISRGKPEVSAFIEIKIDGSEIFGPSGRVLTRSGWATVKGSKPSKSSVSMIIKTRADLLGDDYILDLKSTTGNAKSEFAMRQKVSNYNYDLSAALYLDVFTEAADRHYSEFIWTFASKDNFTSKSYRASTENIMVGRAKYKKALLNIADGIQSGWTFTDSLGILKPQQFELEHIKETASDIL